MVPSSSAVRAPDAVVAPVPPLAREMAVPAQVPLTLPVVDRLDPETAPVAVTELGVIAPSVNVIAALLDGFVTTAETPLAVFTATEVTVPVPGVPPPIGI